jgi:hypothetical protein
MNPVDLKNTGVCAEIQPPEICTWYGSKGIETDAEGIELDSPDKNPR